MKIKSELVNRYKQDIKAFLIGIIKAYIILYLFYKSFLISVFLATLYGVIYIRIDRKKRKEEWKWKMNLEFREVLTGISAALNAGYSIENAFQSIGDDLVLLYGEKSVMADEIKMINSKIQLNQPIEKVLMEFAEYTEIEDIYNFAEVFQTAKKTGGNLILVARATADKISSKIEVSREIKTMIAGKQMEGRIMNIVPPAIIVYFWISSPGMLDNLYTIGARPVTTVFLIMYLAALKWSERIGDISV